jgi:hypothetical protein
MILLQKGGDVAVGYGQSLMSLNQRKEGVKGVGRGSVEHM